MVILLISLFVLSLAIIYFLRYFSRKSFLRGRQSKNIREIYNEIDGEVSRAVFDDVWSKVGESFAVDPGFIRPDDTFKQLSDIDSWDLGRGEDELMRWIEQEGLGRPPMLTTVIDFAKWIQDHRASRN